MNFLMQWEKKEPGIENGRCAYTVRGCLDSGSMSSVLWCVGDSPAQSETPLLLFIFVLTLLLEFLLFTAPWQLYLHPLFHPIHSVSIFTTNLLFSFVLLTPAIPCHPASVISTSVSSVLSWQLSPVCRSSFTCYTRTSWSCSHLFCILWVDFPFLLPDCRSTAHQRSHSQQLNIKSWCHSNPSSWDEQNCSCGGGHFHCGFK